MLIGKVILENHPLLNNTGELKLSLPNGAEGSGLIYIVGQSGMGKTKLLDAIFPYPRSVGIGRKDKINRSAFKIRTIDETGKEIGEVERCERLNPDLEASKHFLHQSEELSLNDTQGIPKNIKQSTNRLGIKYEKTLRNSGEGEARFDAFMIQIEELEKSKDPKIIVVDEPEAFIDPFNQILLLRKFARLAERNQVFISTHSPYFIDWEYLQNGGSIIKVNRVGNQSFVGIFCDQGIAKLINTPGTRNPQLNGVETKNIFFSNKVFVVEGQEDVGVISRYLMDKAIEYDFTFFGFGAGSSSKIANVLELCRDLNIPKAAAFFDNNSKDENKNFRDCRAEFTPYYCIEKQKADDIRDKTEDGKVGAFSYDSKHESYILKTDAFGVDFEEKMAIILKYFSTNHTIVKMVEPIE